MHHWCALTNGVRTEISKILSGKQNMVGLKWEYHISLEGACYVCSPVYKVSFCPNLPDIRKKTLFCLKVRRPFSFVLIIVGLSWRWVSCIGRMTQAGENRFTRRKKPLSFPHCPSQHPHWLARGSKARLRSERLQTAWAFVNEHIYAVFYCGPNREHARHGIHSVLV